MMAPVKALFNKRARAKGANHVAIQDHCLQLFIDDERVLALQGGGTAFADDPETLAVTRSMLELALAKVTRLQEALA